MEEAGAYFKRRAQQERAHAEEATSAEARRAHLELAFRLVNLATDPVSWTPANDALSADENVAPRQDVGDRQRVLATTLVTAFSLPDSGTFFDLLEAIDVRDDENR
jgi:hypothetical protein